MAGYSGTPLPQKLGIKPEYRVKLIAMPAEVKSELKDALKDCIPADGREPIDFAMIFVKSRANLTAEFRRVTRHLSPAGLFWVSWPKKSSGIVTDLTEDEVRKIGLAGGLVDTKVCAVNDIWSGLKFVRRLKDRQQ